MCCSPRPKPWCRIVHRPDLLAGFDRVVGLRAGQLVFDQAGSSLETSQLKALYAGAERP